MEDGHDTAHIRVRQTAPGEIAVSAPAPERPAGPLRTPPASPGPGYRGNADRPASTPSGSGVLAVFITIASIW